MAKKNLTDETKGRTKKPYARCNKPAFQRNNREDEVFLNFFLDFGEIIT